MPNNFHPILHTEYVYSLPCKLLCNHSKSAVTLHTSHFHANNFHPILHTEYVYSLPCKLICNYPESAVTLLTSHFHANNFHLVLHTASKAQITQITADRYEGQVQECEVRP
ncbi:hypothetical protein J6590_006725 [Homalodisca vitripennis]|nr:hypothetical protein J6590_006725 [Homalodisca vitripennis]